MPSLDPYAQYEHVLNAAYGQRGTRYWSLFYETRAHEVFDPRALGLALLDAVIPEAWIGHELVASNWKWRDRHKALPAKGEGEVALEREIIRHARASDRDDWTFQMPTMSGIGGGQRHKKRSLDLVHRVEEGHYEFIELKLRSNDPVHAAFELLFYALAYIRARQNIRTEPDEAHAVLRARRVDLVVLAPAGWYEHKSRGPSGNSPYILDRLSEDLGTIVQHVVARAELKGFETMKFAFCSFEDRDQLLEAIRTRAPFNRYVR